MTRELWREHRQAQFPTVRADDDVAGINLALLDADAAGCLQTLYEGRQGLGQQRLAILGLCARDLAIVTRELDGEALTYFRRLEQLVVTALTDLAHRQLEA
jgi:hypothetical protein